MNASVTGMRPLLKVSLRQEIRSIAAWVLLISALSMSSILSYTVIFPDPDDRAELATSLGANPALALVFGPVRDLMSADGFNAWRSGQLGAFFAALMAILVVVRNSRANEDSGQAELIASGVIARGARLAVAVSLAALASVALGVLSFGLTVAVGGDPTSTLILSATFTAAGLMFAGIAAIAAQLGSDARTAVSLSIATLGVFFVIRGYLDSSDLPDGLLWSTPLGWLEETRPGTDNNPWPLLAAFTLATVLIVPAFLLQARRDFGQGMLAQRPGPQRATVAGNVWGLAYRLHRGLLIAWLISFTGLGLLLGNLAASIGDIVADNPAMSKVIAAGAIDPSDLAFPFLVTVLQIIGIIAAVMGVQIVLRIYFEEIEYRVEPLLAGALRRPTYLASNALVAFGSTAVAMLVAGTALGVIASSANGSISVGDVVLQAISTIPAVWTLVALTLAIIGAAPTKGSLAWLAVVGTFALSLLGPTLDLPEQALDLSPFRHVPMVTTASPNWAGLMWLTAFITGFLMVAFVGFRRRDII